MTPNDIETSKTAETKLCNRLHNLDARIAYYIGAARAPATHRAYAADIAAFLAWGGAIATPPQAVAAYLASSDNLAVSTLRRRLAAIADAHAPATVARSGTGRVSQGLGTGAGTSAYGWCRCGSRSVSTSDIWPVSPLHARRITTRDQPASERLTGDQRPRY